MELKIGSKLVKVRKPAWLLGVLAGVALAVFSYFQAGVTVEDVQDNTVAADEAAAAVIRSGSGTLLWPGAKEGGAFELEQVRPCAPGLVWTRTARPFLPDECGVSAETAQNFLADTGESTVVDCAYRNTNCPTAFTMSLLAATATPAETSAWTGGLDAHVLNGTNAPGYSDAAISRDSTGWTTLDTVANGTGGCTETSCARVSTAQVVITASGNWTAAARYLVIRATVGGAQRLVASAQLSADRQLQNGDQLNLTYRQALQ